LHNFRFISQKIKKLYIIRKFFYNLQKHGSGLKNTLFENTPKKWFVGSFYAHTKVIFLGKMKNFADFLKKGSLKDLADYGFWLPYVHKKIP
jgi:hypothetical protein